MTESQETGKNAPVRRIYIENGNTKHLNLCAVDGQQKKPYTYIYA